MDWTGFLRRGNLVECVSAAEVELSRKKREGKAGTAWLILICELMKGLSVRGLERESRERTRTADNRETVGGIANLCRV